MVTQNSSLEPLRFVPKPGANYLTAFNKLTLNYDDGISKPKELVIEYSESHDLPIP